MISTNKLSANPGIRQKLAVAITGTTLALASFGTFPHSALAGNFSKTCNEISLSDGVILGAKCGDGNGAYKYASINLNRVIANRNGKLSWGGTNFSKSCRRIQLVRKNVLLAECANVNGKYLTTVININERVENRYGKLQLD